MGVRKQGAFLKVGFHTGGFNSAYLSFEQAVAWAAERGIHGIECGFLDGVAWNHGLGYFPHIASWEDPKQVMELLEANGVELSQLDAAFPLSTLEAVGLPYVLDAIRWAALAGCPMIDTTDGLHQPAGESTDEVMVRMRRSYERIVEAAERSGIVVTVETHGFLTTDPERLEELLSIAAGGELMMTMDTGNVFIAGRDPVVFLRRFAGRVAHVHLKDVAPALAKKARGRQSAIGMSHCAVGEGVNADNIRGCLEVLRDCGYQGAVSLECEAAGGPALERSLHWVRRMLDELGIDNDLPPAPSR